MTDSPGAVAVDRGHNVRDELGQPRWHNTTANPIKKCPPHRPRKRPPAGHRNLHNSPDVALTVLIRRSPITTSTDLGANPSWPSGWKASRSSRPGPGGQL